MPRFTGTPVEQAAPAKAPRFGGQPASAPAPTRMSPEFKAALAKLSAITQNPTQEEYFDLPAWQKPLVAASDIIGLAGRAPLLGFGEKAIAAGRSALSGTDYEQELAEQRRLTNAARRRSGLAGTVAEITTQVGSLPSAAIRGGGNLLTRAIVGAGEGAGYGGLSALGEDTDLVSGLAWGAGGGAGGSAFADLVRAGGATVGKAVANYMAEPTERARQLIFEAAEKAGIDPAKISAAMTRHGEDLMTADVLGRRGAGMGRAAANLSPEAREVVESAVNARKAGQNERVVGTIEDVAGLERGGRKTVEEFKKETYQAARPAIDEAYEAARAAGYDLPREPFKDILESPMGRKAYDDAAQSLLNRKAVTGTDAASELARLDQTKRELDDIATAAYRTGNKDRGDQAAQLSRTLRERMDATIAGPEYAKARDLRSQAYKREEAISTGETLAKGRIKADAPGKARAVTEPDRRDLMKKGWALAQSENLLNRGATEGAISIFDRPLQREATQAALGDAAPAFQQRLDTEKMFNRTNRDIVGNSSTAKQLIEAGVLGGTGAGLGWLTGLADPFSGGLLGAGVKGARMLSPVIKRKLGTRSVQDAPEIAQQLVQSPSSIPLERAIPPGVLEQGTEAVRDYLARLMQFGAINQRDQ